MSGRLCGARSRDGCSSTPHRRRSRRAPPPLRRRRPSAAAATLSWTPRPWRGASPTRTPSWRRPRRRRPLRCLRRSSSLPPARPRSGRAQPRLAKRRALASVLLGGDPRAEAVPSQRRLLPCALRLPPDREPPPARLVAHAASRCLLHHLPAPQPPRSHYFVSPRRPRSPPSPFAVRAAGSISRWRHYLSTSLSPSLCASRPAHREPPAAPFSPLPPSPSPSFHAPRQRLSPLYPQTIAVCQCTALCCSMLSLTKRHPYIIDR